MARARTRGLGTDEKSSFIVRGKPPRASCRAPHSFPLSTQLLGFENAEICYNCGPLHLPLRPDAAARPGPALMHHIAPLLIYLSLALVLALILGLVTERMRLSPIVGYLLTGILLGPHTPGVRANVEMAGQIAELGVILLMFGVGLHFNLKDLWAVRKIALPGAVGQITVATVLGLVACKAVGLGSTEGLIVGIAISVASTVVLVRVLVDNNVLETPQGHIAVGWLIVEDIFTVLALVALSLIHI